MVKAVSGEENVSLPNDYMCMLEGNMLNGSLLNPNKEEKERGLEAKLSLKFMGITCSDQFLVARGCQDNRAKRKFSLVNNNSLNGPTEEDRTSAFKKLTEGSDCWYKKVRTEPYVPEQRCA